MINLVAPPRLELGTEPSAKKNSSSGLPEKPCLDTRIDVLAY
jgi:hypothetical protein